MCAGMQPQACITGLFINKAVGGGPLQMKARDACVPSLPVARRIQVGLEVECVTLVSHLQEQQNTGPWGQ